MRHPAPRGRARAAALLGAVAVLAALVGCSTTGSTSKAGTGPLELHLGVIDSITGSAAQYGQDFERGAKMAIDELNNAKDAKVKIVPSFCNSGGDPAQAVTCGKQLQSRDKVTAVVASTSMEAVPLLTFNTSAALGKFVVVGISQAAGLTSSNNPLVVRYLANAPSYLPAMTKLLDKTSKEQSLGIRKVGIMEWNTEAGQALATNFQKNWEALGSAYTVSSAVYQDGTTDFSPQLTSLLAKDPDLIVISQGPASAAIIKQATDLGYKGRYYVPVAQSPTQLATQIPVEDFIGSVFETSQASLDTPRSTKWRDAFKSKYKLDANANNSAGYGSVELIAHAAIAAASVDAEKIRAEMPKVLTIDAPWNIGGYHSLAPSGDVKVEYGLTLVKSADDFELIQP